MYLYYDESLNDRPGLFRRIVPFDSQAQDNHLICLSGQGHRAAFTAFLVKNIPNYSLNSVDGFRCFPFYVYDEDGRNRRENITDWALGEYQSLYGEAVSKQDIFHYIYGLLHSSEYRTRYAANLKRDLPRIPFVPADDFARFVAAGRRLAEIHVGYESAAPHPLKHIENRDVPWTWRVERMKLSKDKTQLIVNEALTLDGIPPAVFDYKLGNRSALEWIIDQYQVSVDKRSGIVSDPNDEDNPEAIVRLVKQIITVSLETVQIVAGLPALAESQEHTPGDSPSDERVE